MKARAPQMADGSYQFARGQNVSGRSTLYDMEVDAGGRHVLTACQVRVCVSVCLMCVRTDVQTERVRGSTDMEVRARCICARASVHSVHMRTCACVRECDLCGCRFVCACVCVRP